MNSYDPYEPRSNFGFFLFLAFTAAALLGAGFYFTQGSGNEESQAEQSSGKKADIAQAESGESTALIDPFNPSSSGISESQDPITPPSAEQLLVDAGMGLAELEPEVLLGKIGESLEASDFEQLTLLLGKEAIDASQLKALQALSAQGGYRLNSQNPLVEIGELEPNRRTRWALNLEKKVDERVSEEGKGQTRIHFDLVRAKNGKWAIEKLKLPTDQPESTSVNTTTMSDALSVTDGFLQSVLSQDFDEAKSFVAPGKVSDAKIAGLCIIFEEAKYQLRSKKPVRAMFQREFTAGFVAHVQDESGAMAAEVGMSLQRPAADQAWRLSEVNLDSLLADYAQRVAGGDVHFTPLIQNPGGGDTLILYFGFDEDGLTPRTERQLDIVAGLLKLDARKKLTLSGHTDALGSDEYNNELSGNRAESVEKYLLSIGVPRAQIVTLAEGEAKPRRPNSTDAGEDNPTGRRANRRTEIYLDF